MADAPVLKSSSLTRIIGSDIDGEEQNPIASADSSLLIRPTGLNPSNVSVQSVISGLDPNNSTTTPLSAGGVFMGDFVDVSQYSSIQFSFITDQLSEENGAEVQFSTDGTEAGIIKIISYTVPPSSTGFYFSSPREACFYRLKYTNGTIAQSSFKIHSILSKHHIHAETRPVGSVLNSSVSTLSTKSVLSAPNDSGVYENIGRNGEALNSINTYLNGISKLLGVGPFNSFETGQITANGTSPVKIPASTISTLGKLEIFNTDSDQIIYYGPSSLVNQTTGHAISPKETKSLEITNDPEVWIIAEAGGSDLNTLSLDADTVVSNTGVSDPTNAFSSDDSRAILDSISDTFEIDGFPASSSITLSDIVSVKLKVEVRKEPGEGAELSTFQQAVGSTSGNVTSETSGTITAAVDRTYLVFVSRQNIDSAVTNVTNTMGLSGFTVLGDVANNDESRTTAILMTGTASVNGTITVQFSEGTSYVALGVMSFTNVLASSPVLAVDTEFGNDVGSISGSVLASERGVVVVGIGAELASITARQAGFTNRLNIGSTFNNDQILDISTISVASNSTQPWSANFSSGSTDTSGIAVSLNPSSVDPIILVEYKVSSVLGTTSIEQVVSSETDTIYEQDITSDRAWTEADLDNTSLVVSLSRIGTANVEVDRAWLEVQESGSSARISYKYEGNN